MEHDVKSLSELVEKLTRELDEALIDRASLLGIINMQKRMLRCNYMHDDMPCMKCGFVGRANLPV